MKREKSAMAARAPARDAKENPPEEHKETDEPPENHEDKPTLKVMLMDLEQYQWHQWFTYTWKFRRSEAVFWKANSKDHNGKNGEKRIEVQVDFDKK